MKIVEGLKPWEVMQQHAEEGKRVAYYGTAEEWIEGISPVWDWAHRNYAIIDDTAPVIDWDGFNWEFFNQYDGVAALDEIVKGTPTLPLRLTHTPKRSGIQLRESPFYPWFGGECLVPANVEVEVVCTVLTRGIGGVMRNYITGRADAINWADQNLIAFRITGVVS